MMVSAVVEKAFGAKDYSKLIPVKQRDSLGRDITVWKLPEDAKQKQLFSGADAGQDAPVGKRGYVDHLDQATQKHMVEPLLKLLNDVDENLASRMTYKYQNYKFDRDTRELDIASDYDIAWYMKKIKADPENKSAWMAEYRQKTDKTVRKLNIRKAAMLKIKKEQQVSYYGKQAIITGFTRRGFPIVSTASGSYTALWEELA